jgi:heme o synthase
MQHNDQVQPVNTRSIGTRLRDYMLLVKFSLTIMVVFSAVVSYLLAPKVVDYDVVMICILFLAGFLVTGSANTINQIVEKDTDALMKRTSKRPVASGRMTPREGWIFAVVCGIAGIFLMGFYFNLLSAALSLFSLFLYAFIYTPLKKVNSISVLVGAFPGALPCLIGYAAGNDVIDFGGWAIFGIQFFWQFPHFWAIAWIAHKDYETAGFKLLPSEKGPTKYSAVQSIIYSVLLIPVGVLPYFAGLTGWLSLMIILAANLAMIYLSIRLYRDMEVKAARKVMFGSYIYLLVVFFALLADKL